MPAPLHVLDDWLGNNRIRLTASIAARQYERLPELRALKLAGHDSVEQSVGFHLDYLGAAVLRRSPLLFVDYAAWAKEYLAGLGYGGEHHKVRLECMRDTLDAESPDAIRETLIAPLSQALNDFADLPERSPTCIDPTGPRAVLARRYLDLLLDGQRHEAMAIVTDAAKAGVPVRELYLGVFAPVQHEIGRLWQQNALSVAEEHYCTAVTQLVISQLYPYMFTTDRKGRTLVATGVSGELHEIGVRMIADFFEMDGWDTYYLGANVPTDSLIDAILTQKADVVAVSATITTHIDQVAEVIEKLRATPTTREIPIIVGGYPFIVEPELWRRVGADGCSSDAEQAVALGNSLVEAR